MKTIEPYFITVEGSEGVGKSTAVEYIAQLLQEANIPFTKTREPGGTKVAEQIRNILLAHHDEKISEDAELLLMFAGRAQHLLNVIKPALASNKWVLCDRFTDASYAYQGGGRGIADSKIALLEDFVQQDLRPNLTLLLDAPPEMSLARAYKRSSPDRFEKEQMDFFKRVREKYLQRAAAFPNQFHIIDASQELPKVEQAIKAIIEEFI